MPRLSVIIPTYNRARLVERAIASAQAQTERDIEILVVDDGSRDDTPRVVERIAAQDARVQHLRQENRGCSAARNHGIQRARAPYVGLLDSDDVWVPQFGAAQIACLERSPQAWMVCCDAAPLAPRPGRPATLFKDPDHADQLSLEAMFLGAWSRPSTWCLRREALEGVGFREECRISEDTDFLFRFFVAGGRAVRNPELLCRWGEDVGPEAETRLTSDDLRLRRSRFELFERYLRHAPQPRQAVKRLFRERRHLAVELVKRGRRREARALLWNWYRVRPLHLGVLKDLLLGFVRGDTPRASDQGTTASASTSIKA